MTVLWYNIKRNTALGKLNYIWQWKARGQALYLDELWYLAGLQQVPDASVDVSWNGDVLQRNKRKKNNTIKAPISS